MNSIFTRRSVRTYQDKPVEKEKVTQLLKAAMQAPSAGNQQPWEFLVITDREKLNQLSNFNPYASCLLKAPLAIIVLGDPRRMKYEENWQQDLGAATQNILLEAVNLDLGAVWLGAEGDDKRCDYIRRMFSMPVYMRPYSVISIGYPERENANKFIDRFDEKRIHYEKY